MSAKYRDIDATHRDVLDFWKHVKKGPGCWEWQGTRDRAGYGQAKAGRKTVRAHRLSWRIHRGVIPDGFIICHKCDNPPCVRPDHLFVGTHQDNSQDMMNKGRGAWEPFNDLQVQCMYQMHLDGKTHAEIGRAYNATADRVRKYLDVFREKLRRTT